MRRQMVLRVMREVAKWVPALLLVFIFVPQGWSKFSDTSGWAVAFRHWGYPSWFRITVGAVELSAAACLLWRRTAPIGALMIVGVMLGGMATHVALEHGRHMTSEVVPLTLALIVLAVRTEVLRQARAWLLPR